MNAMRQCSLALILVLIMGGLLSAGCKEPPPPPPAPTAVDETATLGSAEVSVTQVEVGVPDVLDASGQAAASRTGATSVFIVTLNFKNAGDSEITYSPLHDISSAPSSTTPLLFKMPDLSANEALTVVQSIALGTGFYTTRQVQKDTVIKPGGSISDEYLFKVPNKDYESLLLTIPATLVGGSSGEFVRFEIPNTPTARADSSLGKIKTPLTRDGVEFKITSVSDTYIEAEKTKKDEKPLKYPYAWSSDPVLRIDFEIKNTRKAAVIYSPGHLANDSVGVQLTIRGKNTVLKRYKLAGSGAVAKGQFRNADSIQPGATVKDFFIFQRPPTPGKAELELEVSGHIFEARGLMRFLLEYTRSTPTPPDLEPYKKATPAPPEGAAPTDPPK